MTKALRSIPVYLVFFLVIVILFTQKANYHVDEIWSYGLANYDGASVMLAESGKKYDNPEEPFLDWMTVQEDQRFDYSKVWENQRNDNHPILFYTLLHTICSFFPGMFSKWFGAAINLAFAMVLLFYLRKLIYLFTHSRKIQTILSVGFILVYGIVNATVFIRMYIMAMCWVVMLTYFALRLLDKLMDRQPEAHLSDHPLWYHLFRTAAVTLFGALTHFYFIIYVVALTIGMATYLLINNKWKPAMLVLGVEVLAGVLSLAVFPSMIEMVFKKDRGAEAVNNLHDTSGDLHNIYTYLKIIDQEMFGGFLLLCLGVMVVPAIIYFFDKKPKDTFSISWMYYFVLAFPIVFYTIIVGISSPNQLNRYVYILYPILYAAVFSLVSSLLNYVFRGNKKLVPMIVGALLSVCLISSYFLDNANHFEYLYRDYPAKEKIAKQYEDYNCLCVYRYYHQRMFLYEEAKNYKSITFLKSTELDKLDDLDIKNDEKLILVEIDEQPGDNVLLKISKSFKHISKSVELFETFHTSHTYLLS